MKEMNEENIINEQNNIDSINKTEEKEEVNIKIDKSNFLIESKLDQNDSEVPDIYKLKIITKQANEAFILIGNEKSELSFTFYYYKDYFKITFKNSFS